MPKISLMIVQKLPQIAPATACFCYEEFLSFSWLIQQPNITEFMQSKLVGVKMMSVELRLAFSFISAIQPWNTYISIMPDILQHLGHYIVNFWILRWQLACKKPMDGTSSHYETLATCATSTRSSLTNQETKTVSTGWFDQQWQGAHVGSHSVFGLCDGPKGVTFQCP